MRTFALYVAFYFWLAVALFVLPGCATKTDPAFLQQASAGLFGLTGGYASPSGRMMTPQPRRSGFNDFYNPQ